MRRLAVLIAAALASVALAAAARPAEDEDYRVDAIFPSASQMIPGQEVKIAGAIVGEIEALGLTSDHRARIRLRVDGRYAPFRADASCFIEPASLIGEKFLQCDPGSPRAPVLRGDPPTLPLSRTRSPVDLDLIVGALGLPERQRLALVLNELGMGLVARGRDLDAAIRRANPALAQTRVVLRQLGEDRERLQALVRDTDAVLRELAPRRRRLRSVIARAAEVTATTAAGRDDLSAAVRGLPPVLRQARPALADLRTLTSAAAPLLRDVRRAAPDLDALLREVPALAAAGRPALRELAGAARTGVTTVRRARPVARRLRTFAARARPTGRLLAVLFESLRDRGAVEGLQTFVYYGALATSRFDSVSHILPAHLMLGPCTEYATKPVAGCSAHFRPPGPAPRPRGARTVASGRSRRAAARSPRDRRARRAGARRAPGSAAAAGARAAAGRPRPPPATVTPRRAHDGGLFASPLLVGAITVLVTLVAMALSYNANRGLPFVPTYDVRVLLPDAASLVRGAEVRIGGRRAGQVVAIEAVRRPAGGTYAEVHVALEQAVEPLRADTLATVRPRSVLGLRYLELRPGHRGEPLPQGGALPLSQAQPIVELAEVFDALDRPTRARLRGVVRELGDGLAGRGEAVNGILEALPPVLPRATRVLRAVARGDLRGLVRGAAAAAAALAPEARSLARLLDGADRTLTALAAERRALREVLAELPPTETTGTRALSRIRPVLRDAAAIATALRPGARALPGAARGLARAARSGTPALRAATPVAVRLRRTLRTAGALVADPAAEGSVRALTAVVTSLRPTLAFVNPFQLRCNYLGLWTRNASSVISEGDANGTWFRFVPVGEQDEALQRATPAPRLHANHYAPTGQDGECEIGNEPWLPGQRIGPLPGVQADGTELTEPPR